MPLLADTARSLAAALTVTALVIAGLVLGKDVLMPFALAIVFAFILTPIVRVLSERGIHRGAAVGIVMVVVVSLITTAFVAFSSQMLTMTSTLANHKENLSRKVQAITGSGSTGGVLQRAQQSIDALGDELTRRAPGHPVDSGGASQPMVVTTQAKPAPGSFFETLKSIAGPLTTIALTLLFTAFLLAQHNDIRDRVVRIAGVDNMTTTTSALSDAGSRLSRLFLAQAALNVGFGLFVALSLSLIGVPNAVLWGISSACLRFIPFIGAFLAAIPPIMLAAAVDPGWSMAIATAAVFVIGEPLLGHVVEPIVLGRGVGLSAFAMVLAASFWTLVWGPVGLLLAAPLTMVLVLLGHYVPRLEFLSVLLGDAPALSPAQEFYHRMLSADAPAAVEQLDAVIESGSLAGASDLVVLPALRIAARDHRMESLSGAQVETLCETLATTSELVDAPALPSARNSRSGKASGDVVVIPARGPIDAAAATYVADVIERLTQRRCVTVTASTGLMAVSDALRVADPADVSHVVLSTVGGLDEQHFKLLLRRAARDFPSARKLVCNWAMERGDRKDADPGVADIMSIERLADAIAQIGAGSSELRSIAASGSAPVPALSLR